MSHKKKQPRPFGPLEAPRHVGLRGHPQRPWPVLLPRCYDYRNGQHSVYNHRTVPIVVFTPLPSAIVYRPFYPSSTTSYVRCRYVRQPHTTPTGSNLPRVIGEKNFPFPDSDSAGPEKNFLLCSVPKLFTSSANQIYKGCIADFFCFLQPLAFP